MKKILLMTCFLIGLSAGMSAMIVTHSPNKNVTCPAVDVPDVGVVELSTPVSTMEGDYLISVVTGKNECIFGTEVLPAPIVENSVLPAPVPDPDVYTTVKNESAESQEPLRIETWRIRNRYRSKSITNSANKNTNLRSNPGWRKSSIK